MRPPVDFQPGQRYFKSPHRGRISGIRLVTQVADDVVHYELLYGPLKKRQPTGTATVRSMTRWASGLYTGDDQYDKIGGAVIHKTFVALNYDATPLFRCSSRRAEWYVKKDYAEYVDSETIRLKDATTAETLNKLYGGSLSPFFMAVKNDKCVCCGVDRPLTRHHVVPKRVLPLVPQWRKVGLSNILFVCVECHKKYHELEDGYEQLDPNKWADHFMKVMEPKFLPDGWKLYMIPLCEECDGTGGVDSGGFTPWGEPINIPCPSCSEAKV